MELYRQLLIRFRSLVRKCDYINARVCFCNSFERQHNWLRISLYKLGDDL